MGAHSVAGVHCRGAGDRGRKEWTHTNIGRDGESGQREARETQRQTDRQSGRRERREQERDDKAEGDHVT